MRIKEITTFLFVIFVLSNGVIGQSSQHKTLNWSMDPDAYAFSMQMVDSKWDSKIGGEYFVSFMDNDKLEITTSLGAFINIRNFEENQAFSWQIWRGNIGISTYFNLINQSWLPKKSSLSFQITFAHESQHATDVISYTYTYLDSNIMGFNNGGIRSFEYVKLGAEYSQGFFNEKLTVPVKFGYKYFPTPYLQNTKKMVNQALFAELNIQYKLKDYLYLYSSAYVENMDNSFNNEIWGYQKDLAGEDLKYRLVELGLVYQSKKDQTIGAYCYYTNSNGRGLDFVDTIEGFGGGVRFFL